jgi:hypothetical protein
MMRHRGPLLAGVVLALAVQLVGSGAPASAVGTGGMKAMNWPKCC